MTASQIAWVRIKVLLVTLKHCLGWILVSVAMLGLFSMAVESVVGKLSWLSGPYLTIGAKRFDCSTWWGTGVLLLVHLFLLAWGRDFLPKGKNCQRA